MYQIVNDILITNEIVDDAKRSKKNVIFFKVEKTFDYVKWDFDWSNVFDEVFS